MIPLVHDLSGSRVVVFGGGPVGARKARLFSREARVLVVSPSFADASFDGAEKIRAAPEPEEIGDWLDRLDPSLTVAATDDPAVNEAIEAAALSTGILVNRADRRGSRAPRSVVLPATWREDSLVVAVSTEGVDPRRSCRVRDEIASVIPESAE